jgi:hypothetical protein
MPNILNILSVLYSYIFKHNTNKKNMDSQNIIFQNNIQNEYKNRISLNGEINYSFQMTFLKQYSKFKHSDDIYIEITTNGGDFHIAYMISQIIQKHQGNITILIPFHVLSQGSIIALAANKIILSHIGCIGTISEHIQIQKNLVYLDCEIYENSKLEYNRENERRSICCSIREYFSTSNILRYYFQRLIQKIKTDKNELLDNILDKYENTDEIKRRIILNSNFSKPLFAKDLSGLGLNINIDNSLISNLFSKPIDEINEIDESCKNMKNTLGRISKESSTPSSSSSSSYGTMSNLISLITHKIDVDTQ